MSYEPNAQDAIGAYMVAASDAYGLMINQVNQPSHANVEETTAGTFRIHNAKERDDQGRFLPDVAVCTYDERSQVWTVKLADGETVRVMATGHEEDDTFVVVAD